MRNKIALFGILAFIICSVSVGFVVTSVSAEQELDNWPMFHHDLSASPIILDRASDSPVVIATRPFGINPKSYFMNVDGVFVKDDQLLGLHLINPTNSTLTNVEATLIGPLGEKVHVKTVNFGALIPGVPMLRFFEVPFGGIEPGKYNLTLDIIGDGFSSQTTRPIFVTRTTVIGPNHGMAEVPEGTIEAEEYAIFGGTNLGSAYAPTSFTMTMVPSSPFKGQYSPLPYSDFWWKVGGALAIIGSKIYDHFDSAPGSVGDTVSQVVEIVGWTAALACPSDCFRQGEENTFPTPDEFTTKEVVVINVDYLDEPVVGTPFSAEVDWTFTRYTTGNTYTYQVSEVVTNEHFTTSRSIATDKEIYRVGEDIVITAEIMGGNGAPLSDMEVLVLAWLDTNGDLTTRDDIPDIKIFLRDDGHGADTQAGDGVYTGVYTIKPYDPLGKWGVFVFAQNVNLAGPEEEPLVAAEKLGGLMISAPSFLEFSMQPDVVVKVLPPIRKIIDETEYKDSITQPIDVSKIRFVHNAVNEKWVKGSKWSIPMELMYWQKSTKYLIEIDIDGNGNVTRVGFRRWGNPITEIPYDLAEQSLASLPPGFAIGP